MKINLGRLRETVGSLYTSLRQFWLGEGRETARRLGREQLEKGEECQSISTAYTEENRQDRLSTLQQTEV